MQISLGRRAPSMWFLGEPRNLIASLNTFNKTTEIDFDSLSQELQKKIINDITIGILESDQDIAILRNKWIESYGKIESPKEIKKESKPIEVPTEVIKNVNEITDEELKKIKELLSDKTANTKRFVSKTKDVKFLKKMLDVEKKNKCRRTFMEYIKKTIYNLTIEQHKVLNKEINKAVQDQISNTFLREKLDFDVIDSDEEIVVMTPEELIASVK